MKSWGTSRLFALICLFVTLLLGLTALRAAPGDLDPLDVTIGGSPILTTVVQPDGKILIGGGFTSVLGVPRNKIARLNADGTLDMGFNPNANITVESIVVQPDGKILVGGFFTTLQPDPAGPVVTRRGIARLHADGSLDMGFDPSANAEVLSMAMQADGKIVIVGRFSALTPNGGTTLSRNRIARLNPDGTVEAGFSLSMSGDIYNVAMQGDGKILIGGNFSNLGGTTRAGNARLNTNGTVDTTYASGSYGAVNSTAVQADGKILLGGAFGIVRVNPNGARDPLFNPTANNTVYSMAVQADGKIITVGYFTTVKPSGGTTTPRSRIARLHPDGSLDMDFDPKASSSVNCVAVQPDGKILVAGSFTSLQPNGAAEATPRAGFARLLNDPATESVNVLSTSQAVWLRGGTSPEFARVTFELSSDGGATWAALGAGTRAGTTPNWQIAGVSLPTSGQLRARGVTCDGNGSNGGLLESVTSFSGLVSVPDIAVFTGSSTAIVDERSDGGDPHLFANTAVSSASATQTFTIKNLGLLDLTGLAVTLSGAAPGDFVLSMPGVITLAPGATATFTVAFAPTAVGSRNATVNVVSNDPDENPFDFSLQGTALAATNANLSGMSVSAGSLSPGFVPATTAYAVSLPNAESSITVTPVKAEINASIAIRLNGGSYAAANSGTASGPLMLNAGVNTIDFRVTAQNGSTIKTYTITVTRAGATQGSLDPLNADVNSVVRTMAVQPDGKILIAGPFTSVLGVPRNGIARLNADGTLDTAFNPNANGTVLTVAIQADGKVLLGGTFTTLRPNGAAATTTRNRMARVNADGELDFGFDPNANGEVSVMALQPDGRILLGGHFTTLQPNGASVATTRNRVARVNADGTLDTSFDPNANGGIQCLALQNDGRILIGGSFTTFQPNGEVTATVRNRAARLNSNGTIDAGFDPSANSDVYCLVSQADGKILISGNFTTLQPNGGAVSNRKRIARLNSDGNLDAGFDPSADGDIRTVALQVDGRILLGGGFSELQPNGVATSTVRYRPARVNADGTVDIDFDPKANFAVDGIAQQTDGKVLLAGPFSSLRPNGDVSATTRRGFARLFNEPAAESLTIDGGTRIEWLRSGTAPEVAEVTFELSTDNGGNYTLLGRGTRISGGWELTGISLPGGQVRARGRTTGGQRSSSSGLVELVTNHGVPAVPEISVTGNSVSIPNGAVSPGLANHTDLGNATVFGVGSTTTRSFMIANTGTAELSLGSVTISGPNAADFRVTEQPASLVAGGRSATLVITFDPSDVGLRTAVVSFSSNDADEGSFSFGIQGTGYISSNADLSGLSLNVGTLTPAFSSETTSYAASFYYGYSSIVVTPTQAEANASIAVRVNGGSYTAVASGSISEFLALEVGVNPVDVRVTAQDGTTIKTYTIAISRAGRGPGDLDPLDAKIVGNSVLAVVVQPDGKTIIAGSFSSVLGVPRGNIARLNTDGTLDTSFDPKANSRIGSVALQEDGKMLLGGVFTTLQPNGAAAATARSSIARVNTDGTLDTGFNPKPNGDVRSIVLQPDGKVLIGGLFTTLQPNGEAAATTRNCIARVNGDGTLDTGFDPETNAAIYSVALQPDGKVLLGGGFTTLQPNGAPSATTRNRIARVNADGSLDTGFNPNANGLVNTIAVQPDGKVLLGGSFSTLRPIGSASAITRNCIARVGSDGTLDMGFDPNSDGGIETLALQADGKVLVGGNFNTLRPNGVNLPISPINAALLNADGTVTPGFDPVVLSRVSGIASQADGKVLLAGEFTGLYPNRAGSHSARSRFARVLNAPATQTLNVVTADQVSWLRGGSSPEVSQVTFELSTDGGSFAKLGNATRVGSTANWQLAGLELPSGGLLRARGRTVGGSASGSSGLVETVIAFGDQVTPLTSWRQTHFGSPANSGSGADGFDFDKDGIVNLVEYAFGSDPTVPDSGQLPQAERTGEDFAVSFIQPAGVSGVTYGAEWSEDLETWVPMTDTGTSPQHVFSVPMAGNKTLFMRLRVSAP